MTHPVMHHASASVDVDCLIEHDPDEFGKLLGPIVAGARARGVADAFELMGQAAVLIDSAGCVLHAGARAERALRPLVHIAERHLVGADAETNRCLQRLMESALGRSPSLPGALDVELSDANGCARLRLKALPFSQQDSQGQQLLHTVILITGIQQYLGEARCPPTATRP